MVEEVDDNKAMVNNLVLDSAMVKVSNSSRRTRGSRAEGMAIFKILTSENIRMLVLEVNKSLYSLRDEVKFWSCKINTNEMRNVNRRREILSAKYKGFKDELIRLKIRADFK